MNQHVRPYRCSTLAICRFAALALLLLFARGGWAACAGTAFTIPHDDVTYAGSIDSLKPGDSIGGWNTVYRSSTFFDQSSCANKGTRAIARPNKAPIVGLTHGSSPVYPSGVDGFGYVLQWGSHTSDWLDLTYPSAEIAWPTDGWGTYGYAQVLFVITKRLKPGTYTIPAQTLYTQHLYYGEGTTPITTQPGTMSLASTTITIRGSSCTMTTPSTQTVALPTISRTALASTGATAAKGAGFHIGLNCDAGVALHVTMTDASTPTNTGDTLSLAPGSTAKGVGVQLFYNGSSTPVPYGPDSPVKGNTNQWQVGSSPSAASYDIPLMAGYVSTGTVTPGSVQAKATFTFSYQ